MQDADLLVALAGIAGVFVGFGALISTRDADATELWLIRNVVNGGPMVVAAALSRLSSPGMSSGGWSASSSSRSAGP